MTTDPDVVVVGGGNAGLSAALSAAEHGARVLLLDSGPAEHRGGNSRFTGGLFRAVYNGYSDIAALVPDVTEQSYREMGSLTYTFDDYFAEVMRLTNGRADDGLTRMYVQNSYDTLTWLREISGVAWTYSPLKWIVPNPGAAIRADGDGLGLVERLYATLEGYPNVALAYETTMVDWTVGGDGVEIVAATRDGVRRTIRAEACVLACGGFEASVERRTRYLGQHADALKVRGTRYNTGDVLEQVLRDGYLGVGQWSGCHATPVDADSPGFGNQETKHASSRHAYPFGITVNLDGERFMDEGEDFSLFTYATWGGAILEQPRSLAFQIFDARGREMTDYRYRTREVTEYPSLEDLAAALESGYGLDRQRLLGTVQQFNESIDENVPFDANIRDDRATSGLKIDKTNWATSISEPPFVAYPVTAGITFTYGGIAIDTSARVLKASGDPAKRVFATGEITGGFFYDNYPAGAGLMRGAVFGRIAGRQAAALSRGSSR